MRLSFPLIVVANAIAATIIIAAVSLLLYWRLVRLKMTAFPRKSTHGVDTRRTLNPRTAAYLQGYHGTFNTFVHLPIVYRSSNFDLLSLLLEETLEPGEALRRQLGGKLGVELRSKLGEPLRNTLGPATSARAGSWT